MSGAVWHNSVFLSDQSAIIGVQTQIHELFYKIMLCLYQLWHPNIGILSSLLHNSPEPNGDKTSIVMYVFILESIKIKIKN